MKPPSPTAEGFRLIFQRPAIALAEIAWRWSFAVAFWFLVTILLVEYSDSLPVNVVDRLLIGTRQPALILRALQRILHGSALRFTTAAVVLAISMTIAWVVLASLGRAATLRAMTAELGITRSPTERLGTIASLLALNFLRAATTLAGFVAAIGAGLVASSVWGATRLSAADATRLWLALLFMVWAAWGMLNWLLSTSAIFIAIDGVNVFEAMSATLRWYRDRLGSILAAGTWFGLVHGGAFLTACGAAFTVLGMGNVLGAAPSLFLEFLIVAIYCAVADLLYIGRLAAYLTIIRDGPAWDLQRAQIRLPFGSTPERASIDQSELILSDVPLPAT